MPQFCAKPSVHSLLSILGALMGLLLKNFLLMSNDRNFYLNLGDTHSELGQNKYFYREQLAFFVSTSFRGNLKLPIIYALGRHKHWKLNSSGAGDGIFRLWWSIPCLLVPWWLKSPGHQQAWYWQFRIGNMQGCSVVNLVFFCWTKFKIWYEM